MSAEIRAVPGTSDPQRPRDLQPSAEVVRLLKDLLADAEAGKLRAVAVALVAEGEMVAYCWAYGQGPTSHSLTAAVSDLAFSFAARRHEDRAGMCTCPPEKPA